MNATARTPATPSTGPAAPSGSDNPLLDLLHKHRTFLSMLGVAVLVGATINYFLPYYRSAKIDSSWALYRNILVQGDSFETERLAETLNQARDDDRIYPWVVARAVNTAFRTGDQDRLQRLLPEVEELAASGVLDGLSVSTADGPQPLADYLLARVQSETQAGVSLPEFVNPTPAGQRIRVTLKLGDIETSDIVIGLYEEQFPETCAHFLSAVDAGSLAGVLAEGGTGGSFRFPGIAEAAEEPAGLPLERKWGFFHKAGALSTGVLAGGDQGVQDETFFLLLTQDQPYQDGASTVFGAIVEGEEVLEELERIAPNPAAPGQLTEAVEIISAERVD